MAEGLSLGGRRVLVVSWRKRDREEAWRSVEWSMADTVPRQSGGTERRTEETDETTDETRDDRRLGKEGERG
jgi:hypothetical protein